MLRINLDETCCRLHYEPKKGLSVGMRRRKQGRRRDVVQNVPTTKKRGAFTHIGMICDDASIQPRLPQILLGNERMFSVATMNALRGELPGNVRVWRRKSGWVNKYMMREVLDALLAALGELTATRQVILLLDTCPVHICARFLAHAARHTVSVQYVPAKLTWLLQPLDTHAFARYKAFLSEQYRRHLLRSPRGTCDVASMIKLVALTCRKVLQGVAWAYAFDGNGYTSQSTTVRDDIREALEWSAVPELTARLPSLE